MAQFVCNKSLYSVLWIIQSNQDMFLSKFNCFEHKKQNPIHLHNSKKLELVYSFLQFGPFKKPLKPLQVQSCFLALRLYPLSDSLQILQLRLDKGPLTTNLRSLNSHKHCWTSEYILYCNA